MGLWIEYYREHNGQIDRILGSDGTQPLDGRLGMDSAHNEAIIRANQLRAVQKVDGYRILRGSKPSDLRALTSIIPYNNQKYE